MWRQIEDHRGPFDRACPELVEGLRTGIEEVTIQGGAAAVCGGTLKIIAVIEEPTVIERILTHLGLCAQPPPRAPVRRVDLFQAA